MSAKIIAVSTEVVKVPVTSKKVMPLYPHVHGKKLFAAYPQRRAYIPSVFRIHVIQAVRLQEPFQILLIPDQHDLPESPGVPVLEARGLFPGTDGRADDGLLCFGIVDV